MPLTVITIAMTILAYIAMSQDVLEEGRSKQRLYVSIHTHTLTLTEPGLLTLHRHYLYRDFTIL
jgi:hypothetical protein